MGFTKNYASIVCLPVFVSWNENCALVKSNCCRFLDGFAIRSPDMTGSHEAQKRKTFYNK